LIGTPDCPNDKMKPSAAGGAGAAGHKKAGGGASAVQRRRAAERKEADAAPEDAADFMLPVRACARARMYMLHVSKVRR
jgi:hypothetical protein